MRTYDVVMTPSDDGNWVLKYETDKVIAELKNENERLKKEASCTFFDDCLRLRQTKRKLRHNKRKRCLAMAKWCEERYNYLTCLENWQMTDKEYQQVIGDYWIKWSKRWLELAEKFKETNNGTH